MKINYISFPYAYTDTNERIHISEIQGNVQRDAVLEKTNTGYKIIGNANDESCPNGVCPVR